MSNDNEEGVALLARAADRIAQALERLAKAVEDAPARTSEAQTRSVMEVMPQMIAQVQEAVRVAVEEELRSKGRSFS